MANSNRFWVVGGEFTDTGFQQMIDGTRQVLGPFASYEDARRTWREHALATRSNAHMRFTIAEEPGRV